MIKKMLVEREYFFCRHMKAAHFRSQHHSGPAVHGQGLGSLLVGTLTTGLSLEAAAAFDLGKEGNVTTSIPGLQSSHQSPSSLFFRLRPLSCKPHAIM